jgi:hypothetical protein
MNQFLSGKKHIVYDKIGMSYEDNWLICCEQILFTIYSTSVADINEIRNYMTDEFRRMDESARDINKWSDLSDKFKFHSIWIADISPTAPSEELQGFFSAGSSEGLPFYLLWNKLILRGKKPSQLRFKILKYIYIKI